MDIYVFGIEEQEYLNDIEQSNSNRQKYVSQYFNYSK
jgi:hypothetical protein